MGDQELAFAILEKLKSITFRPIVLRISNSPQNPDITWNWGVMRASSACLNWRKLSKSLHCPRKSSCCTGRHRNLTFSLVFKAIFSDHRIPVDELFFFSFNILKMKLHLWLTKYLMKSLVILISASLHMMFVFSL